MENILAYIGDLLHKTGEAVLSSLSHNWPVLSIAIVTAIALKTYLNTDKLNAALLKKQRVSIFASVAFGAFTPFCACGTSAVIIGMLTTTLPWGPIMAFLTSSPLMSPDGFILTSGIISLRFAVALTIASLAIGLASGFITHAIDKKTKFLKNQTRYQGRPVSCSCANNAVLESKNQLDYAQLQDYAQNTKVFDVANASVSADIIMSSNKWVEFARKYKVRELANSFVMLGLRQILLYFSLFIAVGYLINHFVPDSIMSGLFGAQSIAAVPLASAIGLPLYVTGESAIPVIRSMLDSGASEGSMLSFIITGAATSAWVIAGLATFLKKRVIGLYILFIIAGAILYGYIYDALLLLL